jgi:hypothetical protein
LRHRFATGLVASFLVSGVGCALLAGVDGERHLDEAATTSSSTGSSTSTGSSGSGGSDAAVCSLSLPPPPPAIKGAGGADVLTFAMRSIDIGGPKKNVGFDLDGQCTCPEKPSCKEPSWATADHCDGPNGRDNGTGNAFATINMIVGSSPISSFALSQEAINGKWSLLVKVSGYNGNDDDDQVEVALYATPGLGAKPAWDGTDAWPVAPIALVDGVSVDQPINKDPTAYVTNRVLVAHLPTSTVVFLSSGVHLQVDLTGVVFSATLEKKDSGGVDLVGGTFSGAWPMKALFQGLSGLRVNGNMLICVGDLYYGLVKPALCDEIDLSSAGTAGADCDALSFGVGFEATQALLGPVQALPALVGACPPETDPTTSDCSK